MKMHLVVHDLYTNETDHRLVSFDNDRPTWIEINKQYELAVGSIATIEGHADEEWFLPEGHLVPEIGACMQGAWTYGKQPPMWFFIMIAAAPADTIAITEFLEKRIEHEIGSLEKCRDLVDFYMPEFGL